MVSRKINRRGFVQSSAIGAGAAMLAKGTLAQDATPDASAVADVPGLQWRRSHHHLWCMG